MSLIKKLKKNVKDVVRDPKSILSKAGQVGLSTIGGGIGALAGDTLGKARAQRHQTNAAKAEEAKTLEEQQRLAQGLGEEALARYKSGEIDEGTKAAIEQKKKIQQAQLNQQLGGLGIQSSTTAQEMRGGVEASEAAELDAARDAEYAKAMTALGLDKSAIDAITQLEHQDRMANAQAFSTALSALGQVGGSLMGGKKN